MPVPASKRTVRAKPESMTTRTPSIVRLVSAMDVASTIFRTGAQTGAMAASCSAAADRRTADKDVRYPIARLEVTLQLFGFRPFPAGTRGYCRSPPAARAGRRPQPTSPLECLPGAVEDGASPRATRALAPQHRDRSGKILLQQLEERPGIQCGRHDQQPQIITQACWQSSARASPKSAFRLRS